MCGATQWSWLAAPVRFAVMMLLAVPALHVPGRSMTVALVIAALIVAGLVLWVRRPMHRPPLGQLTAALPVTLLVLVPFAASGRVGVLGVSIDDDMGGHLLLAEAYRSQAIAHAPPALSSFPPAWEAYPLGPHALVAAIVEGLGVRSDLAFTGLAAAIPIILAWTSLAALRRVSWIGRVAVATVVGMPFLIAAYYAEGSFKELLEAVFVLATALMLGGFQPRLGARRWIPLGLVLAGAVSVYSLQGLVWPALFVGAWIVVRAGVRAWSSGARGAWRELRAEVVPGAIGLAVLILVLVPQIPRVERFVSKGSSFGIVKTNIGNLIGPLPVWEAFGVWNTADFRLPSTSPFTAGMWTAFVLALVLFGGLWSLRGGQWMLPVAAGISILVWAYTSHTQSPYVSAKALVIASPLLLLLAVQPLVERTPKRPSWWWLAAPVLALILVARVVDSSWEALRYGKVGSSSHLLELRALRPLLGNRRTLVLDDDDFIPWELAGAHVTVADFGGVPQVALRSEKVPVEYPTLDFDSAPASVLNEFEFVITTRDAAGSEPPPQMHLVRTTRMFELWQRRGAVQPRDILDEGSAAAVPFDCNTPTGHSLLKGGGVAAIREPPVEVTAPPLPPGGRASVTLELGRGKWALESPYQSPLPLQVSLLGLKTTLPPNLDRPGPRWPIGTIVLSRPTDVVVQFHSDRYWLTPDSDVTPGFGVIATRVGTERVVPMQAACGQLVDWYRPA